MNMAQVIISAHELKPYTVTIKLETYSGALGDGATLVSSTDLVLDPVPTVKFISREPAAYHGANVPLAESTGQQWVSTYQIAGITPSNGTIGYTRAQLLGVPGNNTQRAIVWMTGPNLATDGEPFEVIDYNESDVHEIVLTVRSVVNYG
jgi:hypothetical protein